MSKKKITEDEYIHEMNRRLRAHPDYIGGMEFLPHPPGSVGESILGIAWAGIVFHQAYREVLESMEHDFELEHIRRRF
ncbi:hypothetical protein J8I26_06305 [Herbaspirillum sp. LeCh32-8]|uniref:hypothetical protein n=1 Tax=Herbaspirillum sp. LeCh32-8 TaxID=2821356 RepID=UPI001AE2DE37|nr:hypothetical protein [Herbaspirillum sp. LeCh32-8]MBP0597705.1 hypothetical protein [Herbaspirillum sp. LeCh32-8]